MIAPREAFATGHNIAYVSSYFDQVIFAERLAAQDSEACQKHATQMVNKLQKVGANFSLRLRQVEQVAAQLKIKGMDLPTIPPEYQKWVSSIHPEIMSQWEKDGFHGWLYLMGYAIGELRNGLIVLLLSMDFQTQLGLNCSKTIAAMPNRLTEAMERWGMSAVRLKPHVEYADFTQKFYTVYPLIQHIIEGLNDEELSVGILLVRIQTVLPELAKIEKEAVILPSALKS